MTEKHPCIEKQFGSESQVALFDICHRHCQDLSTIRGEVSFRDLGEAGLVELATYLKQPLPERVKVFKELC